MNQWRIMAAGLIAGLALAGAPMTVEAALPTIHEQVTTEALAEGLTYEHKSKLTEAGWVDIHAIIMAVDNKDLSLDIIRDKAIFGSSSSLSDLANQDKQVVGGINGSFFSMGTTVGEVVGIEVEQEALSYAIDDYNYWSNNASNLVMTDNKPFIDYLHISMTLETASGESIRVQGVNTRSVGGEPVIFNRNAYEDTEIINQLANLFKVVVKNDRITEIFTENKVVDIPQDGYILVFKRDVGSAYLPYLKVGQKVTFKQVRNFDLEGMSLALPGGGPVLKDGLPIREGLLVAPGSRHPRTAIGLSADGTTMTLMVVDGRGSSIGATHEELGQYLLEYDVYNAIVMDGGGSSTLVAKDLGDFDVSVKNDPSDGRERGIVNGLGIVMTAPKTTDFKLMLSADQSRVFVNNKIDLSLKARDLNYNPVMVNDKEIAWSMSGGYGIIDNMTFTPQMAGNITLTASYLGKTQSIDIQVIDELIDLEVIPKVIHFTDGVQSFTVLGTDAEGYKSIINNDLLTWEISEPIGTVYEGVFRGGQNPGNARIDVKYQGIKEVAYVVSSDQMEAVTNISTTLFETLVYPETVDGDVERVNDGTTDVLRYRYNFVPSEVSQAVYAVFDQEMIEQPIDQLVITTSDYPKDLLVKGHLIDANDEQYTISFDQQGKGAVPPTMTYPVELKRLYVVTYPTEKALEGYLDLMSIESVRRVKLKDLDDIISIPPLDSKVERYPGEGFDIRIFGATAGRNRLLDEVVMSKVYDVFNQADYAIYAGSTTVDPDRISNDYFVYEDRFKIVDVDKVRMIALGMSQGSMIKTDSSQWAKLSNALAGTVQDTLVIIGTEKLIDNTDASFTKEGELIHETISNYAKKSGKTVFYINASGYAYDLSYYEGIRYIDLNGLWYKVGDDHAVDLYDSFQTVNVHIGSDEVTYDVVDLYPKTNVLD